MKAKFLLALLSLTVLFSNAQILKKIGDKVKQKTDQKVDEKLDKAADAIVNAPENATNKNDKTKAGENSDSDKKETPIEGQQDTIINKPADFKNLLKLRFCTWRHRIV